MARHSSTPPQSHNPLWQYICAQYQNEAIRQHCLALQDLYGLDVNLLLTCGWIESHLGQTDRWPQLIDAAGIWQSRITALRVIRHSLNKSVPSQKRLRARVLALELAGERHEIDSLWCILHTLQPSVMSTPSLCANDLFSPYFQNAGLDIPYDDPARHALRRCL